MIHPGISPPITKNGSFCGSGQEALRRLVEDHNESGRGP